jgi:hypothetical protein
MANFTFLEVHLDVDASDLPFGSSEPPAIESAPKPEPEPDRDRSSAVSEPSSTVPVAVIAGVALLVLAIGAAVAVKLLRDGTADDLAEEF